jgi:hypothetical protein
MAANPTPPAAPAPGRSAASTSVAALAVAARAQLGPGRVQQPGAERLDHAGAAVGAGAAPDAQDDPAAAQVEGGPDQLAGAAAGRGGGRRPPAGETPQPRRLGQLDHRHLVADGQGGHDGLAGGAGAAHLPAGVAGRQGGLDGAVAAVGHRVLAHVQAWYGRPQAVGDLPGHLGGAQGSLELVGNLSGATTTWPPRPSCPGRCCSRTG